MGYRVIGKTEDIYRGYKPRPGLEGPFVYANGSILYYDPKEGQYWDPTTDFYVDNETIHRLQAELANYLSR
jgi:hypothetical protein